MVLHSNSKQKWFYIYTNSQPITINGANQTGVSFTAQSLTAWSISGAISPTAVDRCNRSAERNVDCEYSADANGNYSFTGLANGLTQ